MAAERSPSEILKLVKRRAGVIVAFGITAVIGAGVFSLAMAKTYLCETKIEVGAVGGLNGPEYAKRVDAVTEQLLSHEAFAAVVKGLNLDAPYLSLPEAERNEKREQLFTEMREHTTVDLKHPTDALYYVLISHRSADPDTAANVVSRLSDYYQRLVYDQPTAGQQRTVTELAKSEKESKEALDRARQALVEFRTANAEFLDNSEERLSQVRDQIRQLDEVEVATLEKQKRDLDELLKTEPQVITVKQRQPDSVRLASVEERMRDVNEKITHLTVVEKKTEEHPDVMAQREVLKQLEAEKKKLIDDAPMVETKQSNEQFVALTKEKRETDGKLETALRRRRLLAEQEHELASQTRKTPDIKAKERDLATAEANAEKEHEARAGDLTKAERMLEALRSQGTLAIRTVDPPIRPRKPAGPAPLVLAAVGLLLGLAVGVGIAFALDAADHSFREVDAVAQFLGVPTMGAIHLIQTPSEAASRRKERRKRTALLTAYGVLGAIAAAAAMLGDFASIRDLVKSVLG